MCAVKTRLGSTLSNLTEKNAISEIKNRNRKNMCTYISCSVRVLSVCRSYTRDPADERVERERERAREERERRQQERSAPPPTATKPRSGFEAAQQDFLTELQDKGAK